LKGDLRIVGFPDAAYRNNKPDLSTQRGSVITLCEPRTSSDGPAVARHGGQRDVSGSSRGCIIDFESHKINRTVLSTTVAELYAFQKTYGTCMFLRGLWMDISCQTAHLHMRTDANNLVTTAQTTHLPEQKETIHMIQMLRKEAVSGTIDDLAHIDTNHMLADCLTKASAKPDTLIKAVDTGIIHNVDSNPEFRTLLKHKAYLVHWMAHHLRDTKCAVSFLAEDIAPMVHCFYVQPRLFSSFLAHVSYPASAAIANKDDTYETRASATVSKTCTIPSVMQSMD